MKKKILTLITALLMIVLTMATALAADATTKFENGRLTVSGNGTGAVQIVLFDTEGSPVFMGTAIPDENGKYSMTLPAIAGMKDGSKYTLKTANRDGTAVKSTSVTASATSPATGDTGILLWIGVIAACAIGAVAVVAGKKKTGASETQE